MKTTLIFPVELLSFSTLSPVSKNNFSFPKVSMLYVSHFFMWIVNVIVSSDQDSGRIIFINWENDASIIFTFLHIKEKPLELFFKTNNNKF